MTRVSVFYDYQNVYKGARRSFRLQGYDFVAGQIYPRLLGVLLTDRGRQRDPARELQSVSVFRGEPSPIHSPGGQAACQRQVHYWKKQTAVFAYTRPLKYYRTGKYDLRGEEILEPREKGIDVMLALAMVSGAMHDEYDVCVLMSADTDLLPAVEEVVKHGKRCEVAAWRPKSGPRSRLSLPGKNLWCHWLDENDYQRVHDPTDYTASASAKPN